jgi:TrpR-related protein YerC/YecD
MTDRSREPWRSKEMQALFEAILDLESTAEAEAFLRDLCTVSELDAMAHRWQVAQLVDEGLPYLEVAARAGASTTTVTRVAHSLRYGQDGYRRALDRMARTARATKEPTDGPAPRAGKRATRAAGATS